MAEKLTLVRTGPSSYLKLNAEDAKAWRASHKEYSEGSEPAAESEASPPANQSAKNKAVLNATDKKSDG